MVVALKTEDDLRSGCSVMLQRACLLSRRLLPCAMAGGFI